MAVVDQVDESTGSERAERRRRRSHHCTAVKEEANPFGTGPIYSSRASSERERERQSLYTALDNLYSLRLLLGQANNIFLSFPFLFIWFFCARARRPFC